MTYPDIDFSARRCELECVGEDVHDDLVEVPLVNPYGQMVGVILVVQRDMLRLSLIAEQRIDILHKVDEVGLLHSHLHHTLVNLPQVHQLVDEVQDSFRIALDGFIDTLTMRVVVFLHQGKQRGDNQRQRSTNLMADVHEEAHFSLTHLLGMDMLLKFQAVLLLALTGTQIPPDAEGSQ